MFLPERKAWTGLLLALPTLALAAPDLPRLGQPVDPAYVAERQINVFPDGRGLPPGQGTVKEGAALYAKHCSRCHGESGEGGTAQELAHSDYPLTSPDASKTIGSYWPYATTVFDFVRRSMPMDAPRRLSNDEVYAIVAWLLHENGLISDTAVMNRNTLPQVQMPNRNGFDWIDVHR
jgi:hypothetical protein